LLKETAVLKEVVIACHALGAFSPSPPDVPVSLAINNLIFDWLPLDN